MASESNLILQEPLDKLPGFVDIVLIQIGKVFRESSQRGLKVPHPSDETTHQTISKANSQFHEALDAIEIDLLKAKAVFERDLSTLRANRAEREKAAGAVRLRAASLERSASQADHSSSINASAPKDALTTTSEPSQPPPNDITMSDEPSAVTSSVAPQTAPSFSNPPVTGPPTQDTSLATDPTTTLSPSAPLAPLLDVDFDSMFADTSAADPHSGLDFDLDFSGGDANLNDDPFADLTSGTDFASNTNASVLGNIGGATTADGDGDIDSLMPGIESYVNTHTAGSGATEGVDFDILGLTNTSMNAVHELAGDGNGNSTGFEGNNVGGKQPKATQDIDFGDLGEGGGEVVGGDVPMESNFDDLFFDANTEDMEFGDFDDAWFKNDGS